MIWGQQAGWDQSYTDWCQTAFTKWMRWNAFREKLKNGSKWSLLYPGRVCELENLTLKTVIVNLFQERHYCISQGNHNNDFRTVVKCKIFCFHIVYSFMFYFGKLLICYQLFTSLVYLEKTVRALLLTSTLGELFKRIGEIIQTVV